MSGTDHVRWGEVLAESSVPAKTWPWGGIRRLYLRPQPQTTAIFPVTKDSYTHRTPLPAICVSCILVVTVQAGLRIHCADRAKG